MDNKKEIRTKKFDAKAYQKAYREAHKEELAAKRKAKAEEKKLLKEATKASVKKSEKSSDDFAKYNIGLEQFDIPKVEVELNQVAEETGTHASSTIQLILSNMWLYNDLIEDYMNGEKVKAYFMYQLNSTIFKQLAAFGCVPPKVKDSKKKEESALEAIIKSVNSR